MARVTIILGLCGSGKTWLAEKHGVQTGALLSDEPIGRNEEQAIVEHLRSGRSVVREPTLPEEVEVLASQNELRGVTPSQILGCQISACGSSLLRCERHCLAHQTEFPRRSQV
jgi:hypothetical protein